MVTAARNIPRHVHGHPHEAFTKSVGLGMVDGATSALLCAPADGDPPRRRHALSFVRIKDATLNVSNANRIAANGDHSLKALLPTGSDLPRRPVSSDEVHVSMRRPPASVDGHVGGRR
jgi:hypothetical protein